MNKKFMFWIMALALVSAPIFGAAQEGPGPDDERLSIFRQFIETLDMDDLDKGKGGKEGPSGPRS